MSRLRLVTALVAILVTPILAFSAVAAVAPTKATVSSSYPITGQDVARGTDQLVVYTRTAVQTATPTNVWGAEVVVQGGKVTRMNDRQALGDATGTPIPADGYVLSGHGAARAWLLGNVRIGMAMDIGEPSPTSSPTPTVPAPPTTSPSPTSSASPTSSPTPTVPASPSTSPSPTSSPTSSPSPVIPSGGFAHANGGTYPVAGRNIARGEDALVQFTRTATQTSTPTNVWGSEVVVRGGKVTTVNDRQANQSTAGTPIPADGYVLSGHGAARLWLLANATVGTAVTLDDKGPATATPTSSPTPTATATATATASPSNTKVAGVYYTGWTGSPRIDQLDDGYNLVYLFAAHRGATPGTVAWGYARPQGVPEARAQGRKVLLSTGGAGSGIDFDSRTVSTAFVDSIDRQNEAWGGTRTRPAFDGIDLNTFEADASRNVAEYVWIGQELKRRFGTGFLVTAPPAPWNDTDKAMMRQLLASGALDYAAPQYYDGPSLADPAYIVSSVREWIRDVAGGDASKIVVGFGINPGSANYSTGAQVESAWRTLEAEHPTLRGAFVWSHPGDLAAGLPFANKVAPLIRD
jgi:hypothetical protein